MTYGLDQRSRNRKEWAAEPPRGIHLKRKNEIALLDQGHTMNATGLVGMFAATMVADIFRYIG